MARTQRVMSTAYGEQILLSNATADLLLSELPAAVGLRDMKEPRLKGLLSLEHLWQVMAPGLAQELPALQTLNSIPNNLPIQPAPLIGRTAQIAVVEELILKSPPDTAQCPGWSCHIFQLLEPASLLIHRWGATDLRRVLS